MHFWSQVGHMIFHDGLEQVYNSFASNYHMNEAENGFNLVVMKKQSISQQLYDYTCYHLDKAIDSYGKLNGASDPHTEFIISLRRLFKETAKIKE